MRARVGVARFKSTVTATEPDNVLSPIVNSEVDVILLFAGTIA